MGQDLSLRVMLKAVDSGASSMFKGFGSTLMSFMSGPQQAVFKGFLALSAAAIAFGAACVQQAASFQQAMLNNVAHAGLAKTALQGTSDALLQMAVDVGQTPTALAQALYPIYSSGMKGAEGLNELKLAAESVAGTTTKVTTVSNAASAAFNAFNMHTNNASTNIKRMNSLFDIMNQTVSDGNMQWSAYATKIGDVSAKAAQSGIKFTEANAALAVFTNTGESVQIAGTHLGAMFQSMALDVDKYVLRAKKLHESFDATKFKSLDLAGKMHYLEQITGNDSGKIKAILGNKTLAATFLKLRDHTKDYQSTLKDLNHASGATSTAFQTASSGFNFAMSRAKAAIDVLMIKIGSALLPILTKLVGAVAPAVTWFINFATAVSKNQVAMSLIQAALITFAGVIVAIVLPALVAWAVEMGIVATENIVAMWPVYLVILAIVAIIALVILAIKNWGAIVAWLKAAWSATVTFFQILWAGILVGLKAVGQFFVNVWNAIVNGVKAAWAWIVGIVQAGLAFLVGVFTAPFRAIAALFTWLYSHNTYFKKLIDKIREIIHAGLAWLKNAWQTVINWLAGVWHTVSTIATNAWNAVKTAVVNAVMAVVGWLKTQWDNEVRGLGIIWNKLKDLMGKAWQAVSSLLSNAWNTYIVKPLQNLWKSIVDFASGWPRQAVQWGIGLIQGFINGLMSMLGKVKDAASNIIKNVASILGFHSPAKEGEGRFVIQWGQGMVQGFSSGVIAAIPHLQAAVNMAVHAGTAPMQSPALAVAGGGSIPYGRPPSGNSYSSNSGGNNYHYGDILIHGANQSPDAIAKAVEDRLNRKYRRSGVMGNPAWGARDS